MRSLPAILFFSLAGAAFLCIAALGAFIALFDPNEYREQFRAAVEDLTGGKATLRDGLEMILLPDIGLKTGGMSLTLPGLSSGGAVLELESLVLSLRPGSLLKGILEVREISLSGAQLDYTGFPLCSGLVPEDGGNAAKTRALLSPARAPARDAVVTPLEETVHQRPEDPPSPPAVPAGGNFPRIRLNVEKLAFRDSRVRFLTMDGRAVWHLHLDKGEVTNVRPGATMPVIASGAVRDADGGGGADFMLDALVRPDESGSLNAKVASLRMKLEALGDLPLLLDNQFSLAFYRHAGAVNIEKLQGSVRVAAGSPAREQEDPALRTGYRGHVNMQLPQGGGALSVTGALHADDLELDVLLRGLDPSVRFAHSSGESIRGAPNLTRPRVNRIVGTGKSGPPMHSPVPGGQPHGAKAGGEGMGASPASFWQRMLPGDISLDLALSADSVILRELPLHRVDLKIRALDRQAALPFSFVFFDGSVVGTGRIDFSRDTPVFAVVCQLAGLRVGRFMEARNAGYYLGGVGSGVMELSGQGATGPDIARSLKGKASFQVLNGEVRGFKLIPPDLPYRVDAPEDFLFQRLSAGADIQDGTAVIREILLESSQVAGKGGGVIHLAHGQVDIGMEFMPGGRFPAVPVGISGPYGNLSCGVDMQLFQRNLEEHALEEFRETPPRGAGGIVVDDDGTLRPR